MGFQFLLLLSVRHRVSKPFQKNIKCQATIITMLKCCNLRIAKNNSSKVVIPLPLLSLWVLPLAWAELVGTGSCSPFLWPVCLISGPLPKALQYSTIQQQHLRSLCGLCAQCICQHFCGHLDREQASSNPNKTESNVLFLKILVKVG